MEKQKRSKTDRNLILLIILFALLSLSILLGRLMFQKPQLGERTLLASSQGELPVINRLSETAENQIPQQPEQIVPPPEQQQQDLPQDTRDVRLFFLYLNDDSQISLKSVFRPMNVNNYGPQASMEELLKGPEGVDLDKGYLSLIPQGTKLNQLRIISNTARLDFSEEFAFNPLGYEGFNHQLKQIVYTMTEFPQIDQVLFTIDGELKEYINAEGIYTGEPLSRDSF
jgi:germination protein M